MQNYAKLYSQVHYAPKYIYNFHRFSLLIGIQGENWAVLNFAQISPSLNKV